MSENLDMSAGAFRAIAKGPSFSLSCKEREYQRRFEQWEQARLDYVAKHGQEAWDAKVERELLDLYPEATDVIFAAWAATP